MPLVKEITHMYEPDPLQCGQTVLAMLTGQRVSDIVALLSNPRETKLCEMFSVLEHFAICHSQERVAVQTVTHLPRICFLSLETPKCWHWSLYFKGKFYDPEYGVSEDFPPSTRRYYWEITENDG